MLFQVSGKPLADYNYQERKAVIDRKKIATTREGGNSKTSTDMDSDLKISGEGENSLAKKQTESESDIAGELANLSIDEGKQQTGKEQSESRQQRGNKLKLKKDSNSDDSAFEKYRNLSSTSESDSIDSFDSPLSRNISIANTSDSDLDKSPLNNESSTQSNLKQASGENKTPAHRHKYEGIGRIKKKSPASSSQTVSSPELPLIQRIRSKSGEQEVASPKSPVEIVDLTSDDEEGDPEGVKRSAMRPQSPEEKQERYRPPPYTLPKPQDQQSANQTQSNQNLQPLTAAEEWQLENDIHSRDSLLQQLKRQMVCRSHHVYSMKNFRCIIFSSHNQS